MEIITFIIMLWLFWPVLAWMFSTPEQRAARRAMRQHKRELRRLPEVGSEPREPLLRNVPPAPDMRPKIPSPRDRR